MINLYNTVISELGKEKEKKNELIGCMKKITTNI